MHFIYICLTIVECYVASQTTLTMLRPLLDLPNENLFPEFLPAFGNIDDTLKRLVNGDDDLLSCALGTDKERLHSLDEWKMAQLLGSVASAVASLQGVGADSARKFAVDDEDDEPAPSGVRINEVDVTTAYDLTPMEYFVLRDSEVLESEKTSSFLKEISALPAACCEGEKAICVVYDGVSPDHKRTACVYGVCSAGCGLKRGDFGTVVNLEQLESLRTDGLYIGPSTSWEDESACLINGKGKLDKWDVITNFARVRLLRKVGVADDAVIPLLARKVVSRQDEDEICTFLRRDMKAYMDLLSSIASKAKSTIESEEVRMCQGNRLMTAREMKHIESKYLNQRIWKWVASSLAKGVRDQCADFNRPILDVVPASWTIKVGGRAGIIAAAENDRSDDEKDAHEDTVCMVCFDGSSSEGNSIIFCDGCNSPAHQNCYGIMDIPEGDYFCDRCRAVQTLAEEYDDLSEVCVIKDVYRCCLCPVYHGAMKPTTDGRWAHLCCAIWCGSDASIVNLEEMSCVDVSRVPLVTPLSGRDLRAARSSRLEGSEPKQPVRQQDAGAADASTTVEYFSTKALAADNIAVPMVINEIVEMVASEISGPAAAAPLQDIELAASVQHAETSYCGVCQQAMGRLVSCSHSGNNCSKMMHPLCAWFAGYYVQCQLTELSFLSVDREDGLYPAGLTLCVYCPDHCPVAGAESLQRRQEQIQIRHQYRISEDDLNHVPGIKKRKLKKKKKPETTAVRVTGTANTNKDLPVDIYDKSVCAICLLPTTTLLEAAGFPSQTDTVRTINCLDCGVVVHKSCVRNSVALVGPLFPVLSTPAAPSKSQSGQHLVAGCETAIAVLEQDVALLAGAARGENMDLANEPILPPKETLVVEATAPTLENAEIAFSAATEAFADNQAASMSTKLILCDEAQSSEAVSATDVSTAAAVSEVYSCSTSQQAVATTDSKKEHQPLSALGWTCDPCVSRIMRDSPEGEENRCQVCPRRGGSLLMTQYGRWLHSFCADHLCTIIKDTTPRLNQPMSSLIVIKNIPGPKKQNCAVCNRKSGVCVKCHHPECSITFHPICAQRTGTHYIRISNGNKLHYCPAHIPEQVYRLALPPGSSSVYWVNAFEVKQLRVYMDKARMILDLIVRRERTRRLLVRVDGESFDNKYRLMCRRLWLKYRAMLLGLPDTNEAKVQDEIKFNEELNQSFVSIDVAEEPMVVIEEASEACKDENGYVDDVGQTAISTGRIAFQDANGIAEVTDVTMVENIPIVNMEAAAVFPLAELTDAMKEIFGQFMCSNTPAIQGTDDDDMDVENDEYDPYNDNVILSPGMMRQKRESLAGNATTVASSKRIRKSKFFENIITSDFEGALENAAKETDAAVTGRSRKRGRNSNLTEEMVLPAVSELVTDNDAGVKRQSAVPSRSRVSIGSSYKRDEPRQLNEVKQFDMTIDGDSVVQVDISASWLTRASRRFSEDEVLHFSKSDSKFMIDIQKLNSLVVTVSGQSYDKSEIGSSAGDHLKHARSDIENALVITRAATGLFADQSIADDFDSELGDYLNYCLEISAKNLEKELFKTGVIRFKSRNGGAKPKVSPVFPVLDIESAASSRGKKKSEPLPPPLEHVVIKPLSSDDRNTKQLKLNFLVKKSASASPIKADPLLECSKKRKGDVVTIFSMASPPSRKKSKQEESVILASPNGCRPATVNIEEANAKASEIKVLFDERQTRSKANAARGFASIIDELFGSDINDAMSVKANNTNDMSALIGSFGITTAALSGDELLTLERKCSYILTRVDDFQVPVGVENDPRWVDVNKYLDHTLGSKVGSVGKGKKGRNNSSKSKAGDSTAEMREPAEQCREFLYEDLPEVRTELGMARPPLSLIMMRSLLREHEYTTFWKFANDFYFMLNCCRRLPTQPTVCMHFFVYCLV